MSTLLSRLEINEEEIKRFKNERRLLLKTYLHDCNYPTKRQIGIKRMTVIFEEIVDDTRVLKLYHQHFCTRNKKLEHEILISKGQCRRMKNGVGDSYIAWNDVDALLFAAPGSSSGRFYYGTLDGLLSLGDCDKYRDCNDRVIARIHVKHVMARKIQSFIRERFAKPEGFYYMKAEAHWCSMVDLPS